MIPAATMSRLTNLIYLGQSLNWYSYKIRISQELEKKTLEAVMTQIQVKKLTFLEKRLQYKELTHVIQRV